MPLPDSGEGTSWSRGSRQAGHAGQWPAIVCMTRLSCAKGTFIMAVLITCIVVLPTLALVFYVVRRSKPGRFRLSATLLKLVTINIEVDAQDKPDDAP